MRWCASHLLALGVGFLLGPRRDLERPQVEAPKDGDGPPASVPEANASGEGDVRRGFEPLPHLEEVEHEEGTGKELQDHAEHKGLMSSDLDKEPVAGAIGACDGPLCQLGDGGVNRSEPVDAGATDHSADGCVNRSDPTFSESADPCVALCHSRPALAITAAAAAAEDRAADEIDFFAVDIALRLAAVWRSYPVLAAGIPAGLALWDLVSFVWALAGAARLLGRRRCAGPGDAPPSGPPRPSDDISASRAGEKERLRRQRARLTADEEPESPPSSASAQLGPTSHAEAVAILENVARALSQGTLARASAAAAVGEAAADAEDTLSQGTPARASVAGAVVEAAGDAEDAFSQGTPARASAAAAVGEAAGDAEDALSQGTPARASADAAFGEAAGDAEDALSQGTPARASADAAVGEAAGDAEDALSQGTLARASAAAAVGEAAADAEDALSQGTPARASADAAVGEAAADAEDVDSQPSLSPAPSDKVGALPSIDTSFVDGAASAGLGQPMSASSSSTRMAGRAEEAQTPSSGAPTPSAMRRLRSAGFDA